MTPADIRKCADDDARHFELLCALADVYEAAKEHQRDCYNTGAFSFNDALARVEALKL